jgi:branched-chain amino acid transport system ATP-binding protein
VLDARGLVVHYPRGPLALDDVGVIVHPGEAVAVVGPNGSGKSTLLRALAGLVPLRSGVVRVGGVDVTLLPAHRRAVLGIAYAPERARVLEEMSVRDNLIVGAWLRKDREALPGDLERILARFPALREKLARPAADLSGGERQMVVLGRALLAAPRILLLDEPLFGLDAAARGRALDIIRASQDDRRAILLAEHDLPAVQALAGRVYGLRAGRVVFAGSAAALDTAAAFSEIYD